MIWIWGPLVSHALDLAWSDLAKISMLRLNIGSGMLRLSSCMLRLGLRLSIGSCMLRLGLRLRLRLSLQRKRLAA